MIVIPSSLFNLLIISYITAVALGSNPDTGSSNNKIFLLAQSALAKSTLCLCPPDNSEKLHFERFAIFNLSKSVSYTHLTLPTTPYV